MDGLKVLGFVVDAVVSQITGLIKIFNLLLTPIRAILNLFGGDTSFKSSVGAAAQPAKFNGFEEYEKQLQLAAYSEPGNATQSDVPKAVLSIQDMLQKVLEWTNSLTPSAIADAIVSGIKGIVQDPHKVGDAVQGAVEGATGSTAAGMGARGVLSGATFGLL
jgi:hypothetical protein